MAAVSAIKKLQGCERIGRDDYLHVNIIKYKIKIRDCASSSPAPFGEYSFSLPSSGSRSVLIADQLSHVYISPAANVLHHDHDTPPPRHASSSTCTSSISSQQHCCPANLLQQLPPVSQHARSPSSTSARSPLNLETENLQTKIDDSPPWESILSCSQMSREEHQGEELSFCFGPGGSPFMVQSQSSPKVQKSGSSSDMRTSATLGQREEGEWGMLPWKLKKEGDEELETILLECGKRNAADGEVRARSSPWKVAQESKDQKEKEAAARKLVREKKEKKQKQQGGAVKRMMKEWEVLKKVECECCGMEEECSKGYEERVRGKLCGHWLCGLCEEAVREEQQRLGGKAGGVRLEVALQAHMQPCRTFSNRARAKDAPPPSAVAVPHAVCRLLRRHLSTPAPSPRLPSSSAFLPNSIMLPRSSSCLPSFHATPATPLN